MKRLPPIVLAAFVAFSAGYLLHTPTPGDRRPVPTCPDPPADWSGAVEFQEMRPGGKTLALRPTRMVVGSDTRELVPNGAVMTAPYRLKLPDGTLVYFAAE